MKRLTKGLWVVVADSEKVMILENTGDAQEPVLHEIDRMEAAAVVMNSDRPGRVHESMQNKRSAHETPDFERLNAEAMVADLMIWLEKQATNGAFEQMVLVAPPQVLGAMRDKMDHGLRARVVAEMDKTLTKHPLAKIAELVGVELARD